MTHPKFTTTIAAVAFNVLAEKRNAGKIVKEIEIGTETKIEADTDLDIVDAASQFTNDYQLQALMKAAEVKDLTDQDILLQLKINTKIAAQAYNLLVERKIPGDQLDGELGVGNEMYAPSFTNEYQLEALKKAIKKSDLSYRDFSELLQINTEISSQAYSVLTEQRNLISDYKNVNIFRSAFQEYRTLFKRLDLEQTASKFTNEYQLQALMKAVKKQYLYKTDFTSLQGIKTQLAVDAYDVLIEKKLLNFKQGYAHKDNSITAEDAAAMFENYYQVQVLKALSNIMKIDKNYIDQILKVKTQISADAFSVLAEKMEAHTASYNLEIGEAASKFTNEYQLQALKLAYFVNDDDVNQLLDIKTQVALEAYGVLVEKMNTRSVSSDLDIEKAASKFTNEYQLQALKRAYFVNDDDVNQLLDIKTQVNADAYSALVDQMETQSVHPNVDIEKAASKFTNDDQVQELKRVDFVKDYVITELVSKFPDTHEDL